MDSRKIKAQIRSLRLRATPLGLAGIIMGYSVAIRQYDVNFLTFVFLALTAVFLQFVSNLSNELGDNISGTDTAEREGMRYSLQSGTLSVQDLKNLIIGCAVLSCVFGLAMIYLSVGTLLSPVSFALMVLGAVAIWAAVRYTLGKKPYGYRGLGDISVFLFFGLATTCVGYFICTGDWNMLDSLLPGCAMGCFSVGVLNVNNIRDMKTDAATRKTVAIRLGEKGARIYHTLLLATGWACMIAWAIMEGGPLRSYSFVLTLPLFIIHLAGVWKNSGRKLDKMVPILAMSTFLLAILTLIR